MNLFKFIKNYMKMRKVLNELKYRKNYANAIARDLENSLNSYKSTLSPYVKRKIEFQKGKSKGYENSIIVIEKFIDTGELLKEDVTTQGD